MLPLFTLGSALLGGFGLGLFSNFANGCPFRQHILAGQGEGSAWWYLGGFYIGAVLFYLWIMPLLS